MVLVFEVVVSFFHSGPPSEDSARSDSVVALSCAKPGGRAWSAEFSTAGATALVVPFVVDREVPSSPATDNSARAVSVAALCCANPRLCGCCAGNAGRVIRSGQFALRVRVLLRDCSAREGNPRQLWRRCRSCRWLQTETQLHQRAAGWAPARCP